MIAHYSYHIPICVFYKYETLKAEEHEEYLDEHNGLLRCSCPNTAIYPSSEFSTSPVDYVESDLLLLISQRCIETIKDFYSQGYQSLVVPTNALFTQYIEENRQVEIIKFIWTETNIEKQEESLRYLSEKNLAIFALEYSLFTQSIHEKKDHRSPKLQSLSLQNVLLRNRKGLILSRLDVCCLSDENDRDLTNFAIETMYKIPAEEKQYGNVRNKYRNFISTLNIEQLSSPLGAKKVRTGNEYFPKEKWADLRQQELSYILENEKTLL